MTALARRLRLLPPAPLAEPVNAPATIDRIRAQPMQLAPIPWGKPNAVLGAALCQHIVDATPPTVIPANPITGAKLRQVLRTYRIL